MGHLQLVQFLQDSQPLAIHVLRFLLQALHVVLVKVLPSQVLVEVDASGQAAAAVTAIMKKTNIKMLTALTIVLCLYFLHFQYFMIQEHSDRNLTYKLTYFCRFYRIKMSLKLCNALFFCLKHHSIKNILKLF